MKYWLTLLLLAPAFFLGADNFYYQDYIIIAHSKDKYLAEEILRSFQPQADNLQKQMGFYPPAPKIFLTASREEFNVLLKNTSLPNTTLAFYDPRQKTIYIRHLRELNNLGNLTQIILHEYVHFILDYRFKNLPLWFNEGMAVYFSESFSLERLQDFCLWQIGGNSLPLKEMQSYPRQSSHYPGFYAKSAFAVKYMLRENKTAFYNMFDAPTADFSLAFLRGYGYTPRQFSIILEKEAQKEAYLALFYFLSALLWALLPLILIAGYIKRKLLIYQYNRAETTSADAEEFLFEENETDETEK